MANKHELSLFVVNDLLPPLQYIPLAYNPNQPSQQATPGKHPTRLLSLGRAARI